VRILIAGGGIAGLASAIALEQAGAKVELMEAQPAWAPLSSGMFLQSNGLAMLRRLGILSEVLEAGFAIPDDLMPVSTFDGRPITDVRYPRLAGPEVPAILGIERVVLHGILTHRVEARGIDIRLGTRPTVVRPPSGPAGTVQVEASDGSLGAYDLVVGADGIRSALRAMRFPERAEPRYSGFGVFRCVGPRPRELRYKLMLIGPGARLGIMPTSEASLYMFGICREPGDARYEVDDLPVLMRERFANFVGPAPEVFASATRFHYTAVEEVPAGRPLWAGRVVLVGDAAHATTPFMGQGGSMALEDAVVLADAIGGAVRGEHSVEAALASFADRRYPRVEVVPSRSLEAGRAWGGDASGYSPDDLRASMQMRVDSFYARLAQAP
jgi:2-polyprenyl-6-methoxyphenol hydroxylase-like FAD-dependent oxidoreductase